MKIPKPAKAFEQQKRIGAKVYNSRRWRGSRSQVGTRKRILERDLVLCRLNIVCDRERPAVAVQVHHQTPINQQGDESDENLISSCARCHTEQTRRETKAKRNGSQR